MDPHSLALYTEGWSDYIKGLKHLVDVNLCGDWYRFSKYKSDSKEVLGFHFKAFICHPTNSPMLMLKLSLFRVK